MRVGMILAVTMSVAWAGVASGQATEDTIYLPPVEDTKEEVDQLTTDLTPAARLQEVLAAGNTKLAEAIAEHRQQRTFATKDKVYNLLGEISGQVIQEISNLEANRDRIRDSVRTMLRKVEGVHENLDVRKADLARRGEELKTQVEELEAELRRLARAIRRNPENEEDLRREFRRKLVIAKRLSRQYRAVVSHDKVHDSFAQQVDKVVTFLGRLDDNLDMLLNGLTEQKNLLVMKVQLLRDSAEVEQWLRDVSAADHGVVAVATRIIELQKALEQFDAATDLIVRMDDMTDVIDAIPDISIFELPEGGDVLDARQVEDRYIDYYLGG